MYPGKYEGLTLTILLKESDRRQHGGYKYLVTHKSFSYTAFMTQAGLRKWISDRGLSVGVRRDHWRISVPLNGSYCEEMMNDEAAFARLRQNPEWRVSDIMSNGDYTTALIRGRRIVFLNPNCKRDILPYRWD